MTALRIARDLAMLLAGRWLAEFSETSDDVAIFTITVDEQVFEVTVKELEPA